MRPNVITTVQCSICSQLNNKPRVYIVVTDFRLHHTCSIIILLWLHSLSGVIGSLPLQPTRNQPRHNNYKRVREHAHLIHVHMH